MWAVLQAHVGKKLQNNIKPLKTLSHISEKQQIQRHSHLKRLYRQKCCITPGTWAITTCISQGVGSNHGSNVF